MADPGSDVSDEGQDATRARMSIAERAARRERVLGDRDRFSSLVRVLRAGREIPLEPRRRHGLTFLDDLAWNPIATRLTVLVVVVILVAIGAKLGGDWLRERSVATWSGPTATVTSGQRLDSCPDAGAIAQVDTYPSWLRYGGHVYLRTDTTRPGLIDGVSYVDSGYRLDHLFLVLLRNTPAGRAEQEVMIWSDGAMAGYVYTQATSC